MKVYGYEEVRGGLNNVNLTNKLKSLISSASNESNDVWISFMEEIDAHLGFLLSGGRPKKIDIQSSVIGLSNCNSWKDYIVLHLEWNMGGWNLWKKSYNLVKQYPYLKKLRLTASQINTVAKMKDFPFPQTAEEYNERIEFIKKKRINEKEKTTSDLQQTIFLLREMLSQSLEDKNRLIIDFNEIKTKYKSTELKLQARQKKVTELSKNLNDSNNEIEACKVGYKKIRQAYVTLRDGIADEQNEQHSWLYATFHKLLKLF